MKTTNQPKGNKMIDFQITAFDFNATEATIVANSEKGKAELARRYGDACVSINVQKSALLEVAKQIENCGFTIQ
jgi:hypothetical protein